VEHVRLRFGHVGFGPGGGERAQPCECALSTYPLARGLLDAVPGLAQLVEAGHVGIVGEASGGVLEGKFAELPLDPCLVDCDGARCALDMRRVVSQAGIIELDGRARDGRPWPKAWDVRGEDPDAIRARAPWLRLPSSAAIRASRAHAVAIIEQWLGEPGALKGRRGVASVQPPAAAVTIAAFETAQGFRLPSAYRELLQVADGVEIGRHVVMGTSDAYRLDIPGPDQLVIAPPDETGALVLAPSGEVLWVDIDDPASDGRRLAADLRAWLR